MKIKLSFTPGEDVLAERLTQAIKRIAPSVKVKDSSNHPPYRHRYFVFQNEREHTRHMQQRTSS